MREEIGDIRTSSLVVHAYTVEYDNHLPALVSVVYAVRFEGGTITPSDDMTGAQFRWAPVPESGPRYTLCAPTDASLSLRNVRLLDD